MMIRRTGWILMLLIFKTVSTSDSFTDVTSESSPEISLATTPMLETPEYPIITEISNDKTIETPKFSSPPSLISDVSSKEAEKSETSSLLLEMSYSEQPISHSLMSNQDASVSDELEIPYQSTTALSKDSSTKGIPVDISSFSNSGRNVFYYVSEYEKGHDTRSESPDMAVINNMDNAATSLELASKNSNESKFNDTPLSIENPKNDKLDDKPVVNDTDQVSLSEIDEVNGAENNQSERSFVSKRTWSENQPAVINTDSSMKQEKDYTTEVNNSYDRREIIDDNHSENESSSYSTMIPLETPKIEETLIVFINKKAMQTNLKDSLNISDPFTKATETSNNEEENFPDIITENIEDFNMSADATEISTNSTRNPKRFHDDKTSYILGYIKPIHPDTGYGRTDTGYARPDLIDRVRPLHPDPVQKFPYYRPTPDSRVPIVIKDDKDTKATRPDSEYQRPSFRPNYSYSKSTQDETSFSKSTSKTEASTSKPYRPSFRPYQQSSFGRPYRPDFHRPVPKPAEETPITQKPTTEIKGTSGQDFDVSEFSRADYDYTRFSEAVHGYTKTFLTDVRPSPNKPDITETYRPPYDSKTSMHSKTPSSDIGIPESIKTDLETGKPSAFYPRPGFGANYHTAGTTAVRPFSVGTVIAAKNLTRVEFIKADCFDNHMKVTMRFNGTFSGLVYSSGYAQDNTCSYVNGSGRNHYEFFIRLNRCGTIGQQEVAGDRLRAEMRRREERAQYLVNTVTVQYNSVIEEDIDEHFRVTCEYGYDFWKTVTFPIISVESPAVRVRTGSPVVFTLPPPQCNMEIRRGYGLTGSRVSGPVNVGDPLTLVIHMKSESTGFDILVSNCYAHNGAQKRLQLIDSNGCVAEEQILSDFRGVKSPDRRQQITLYSFLKAFRFTGSPALYIECDVHMCHGSCPPQRCHWRKLFKRSVEEEAAESITPDSLMSESVSLFQALEVRHEEVDKPNLLALRNSDGVDSEDLLCLKTGGFAAILACLLLLFLLATCAAVLMCLRMRKMKRFVEEAPDTKHFVEFSGHVPLK